MELFVCFITEAKLSNTNLDVVFIQEAEHTRLTLVGRDDADAKVQFFFACRHFDTAVLLAAFFSDVDIGQDFDPGDDRTELTFRQSISFVQHTVNSVANSNAVFEGFDVDIRGPQLNGFGDHQLDQTHDRGAAVLGGFPIFTTVIIDRFGKVNRGVGEFLQNRVSLFTFDLTVLAVDFERD